MNLASSLSMAGLDERGDPHVWFGEDDRHPLVRLEFFPSYRRCSLCYKTIGLALAGFKPFGDIGDRKKVKNPFVKKKDLQVHW